MCSIIISPIESQHMLYVCEDAVHDKEYDKPQAEYAS